MMKLNYRHPISKDSFIVSPRSSKCASKAVVAQCDKRRQAEECHITIFRHCDDVQMHDFSGYWILLSFLNDQSTTDCNNCHLSAYKAPNAYYRTSVLCPPQSLNQCLEIWWGAVYCCHLVDTEDISSPRNYLALNLNSFQIKKVWSKLMWWFRRLCVLSSEGLVDGSCYGPGWKESIWLYVVCLL